MQISRLFSWRLWLITALLIMAIAVMWDVARKAADDGNAHKQLSVQAQQLEVQTDQNARLIQLIQSQDGAFASDRAILLGNQAALVTYTKALAQRQADTLAYMQAHGIPLPTRLITLIQPPVIRTEILPRTGTSTTTKGKGHGHKK
jgi:hypothetical protein